MADCLFVCWLAANHIRPKGGRTLPDGTDLATKWAYVKTDVKNWAYSLYL